MTSEAEEGDWKLIRKSLVYFPGVRLHHKHVKNTSEDLSEELHDSMCILEKSQTAVMGTEE